MWAFISDGHAATVRIIGLVPLDPSIVAVSAMSRAVAVPIKGGTTPVAVLTRIPSS
jgi:hypothetical protein